MGAYTVGDVQNSIRLLQLKFEQSWLVRARGEVVTVRNERKFFFFFFFFKETKDFHRQRESIQLWCAFESATKLNRHQVCY